MQDLILLLQLFFTIGTTVRQHCYEVHQLKRCLLEDMMVLPKCLFSLRAGIDAAIFSHAGNTILTNSIGFQGSLVMLPIPGGYST